MIEIKNDKKASQFATIFQNLKLFTDELFLIFEEDKLYIQGMDSSHVSMFELVLHQEWFDTYQVDETTNFGISTTTLNKVFHTKTADQFISMDLSSEILTLNFFNENSSSFIKNKEFKIKLLDIDTESLGIPEQEYTVDIQMETKTLKSILDEMALFIDSITITCNDNEIKWTSESDTCSIQTNVSSNNINHYSLSDDFRATFNLKYLQMFCQFHKLCDTIWVHMSEDTPLQMKYVLENESYIRFYLAPKIDDSDYSG